MRNSAHYSWAWLYWCDLRARQTGRWHVLASYARLHCLQNIQNTRGSGIEGCHGLQAFHKCDKPSIAGQHTPTAAPKRRFLQRCIALQKKRNRLCGCSLKVTGSFLRLSWDSYDVIFCRPHPRYRLSYVAGDNKRTCQTIDQVITWSRSFCSNSDSDHTQTQITLTLKQHSNRSMSRPCEFAVLSYLPSFFFLFAVLKVGATIVLYFGGKYSTIF